MNPAVREQLGRVCSGLTTACHAAVEVNTFSMSGRRAEEWGDLARRLVELSNDVTKRCGALADEIERLQRSGP